MLRRTLCYSAGKSRRLIGKLNSLRTQPLAKFPVTRCYASSSALFNQEEKKSEIVSAPKSTNAIMNALSGLIDAVKNPKATWVAIKEGAHHYWLGTKLLWSDIKITWRILSRLVQGYGMTRRERMQLIRTTTDIFRLVPFSIFIIVPFMELLLPVALKLFPNMLPSTFQDSLKKEEQMKQELQMRLAVAKFMKETLQAMADKKAKNDDSGATEVIEFIEKARLGEPIPNETVIRMARLFKDELTLANVSRPQLVSMCQYMGLNYYGGDTFLRFQLRSKFRQIQDDDKRILWEGLESLNILELREACRERGMRSLGISEFRLRNQLQEWFDLSTMKNIPISLLIMSRALMLSNAAVESKQKATTTSSGEIAAEAEQVLKSSMSSLDEGTINEVVLAAASSSEKDTTDMRKRQLESLEFQTELIDGERLEVDEAMKAAKLQAAKKAAESLSDSIETAPVALIVSNDTEVKDDKITVEVAPTPIPPFELTTPPSQSNESDTIAPSAEITSKPPVVDKESTVAHAKETVEVADSNESKEKLIAQDSAVSEKSEDSNVQDLTVNELLALTDLARGSVLQREISELALLEVYLESLPLDIESASSEDETPSKAKDVEIADSNSISTPGGIISANAEDFSNSEQAVKATAVNKKVDKNVMRMRTAVSSMLSKLKVRINTTEKVLGDRLKLLDKDGDGEVSADEIKEVMGQVLKKSLDEASFEDNRNKSVEQLFDLLDSNKDGKVSIAELTHYIQMKLENVEGEALEARVRSSSSGSEKEPQR